MFDVMSIQRTLWRRLSFREDWDRKCGISWTFSI